jgi:hypothetical protein
MAYISIPEKKVSQIPDSETQKTYGFPYLSLKINYLMTLVHALVQRVDRNLRPVAGHFFKGKGTGHPAVTAGFGRGVFAKRDIPAHKVVAPYHFGGILALKDEYRSVDQAFTMNIDDPQLVFIGNPSPFGLAPEGRGACSGPIVNDALGTNMPINVMIRYVC